MARFRGKSAAVPRESGRSLAVDDEYGLGMSDVVRFVEGG